MSSEAIVAATAAVFEAYNAFDQAFERVWQLGHEVPLAPANYTLHSEAQARMEEARAKYRAACVELDALRA